MAFAKYQEGQKVSGYTKNNNPFTGYVKTINGEKRVFNEDGKYVTLSSLSHLKQIGKILNEEFESIVTDFTTYAGNTYDLDKVSKASDEVHTKIVNEFLDASDDNDVKTNRDAIQVECENALKGAVAEEKIENGSSTPDAELENLKKDEEQKAEEQEEAEKEEGRDPVMKEGINLADSGMIRMEGPADFDIEMDDMSNGVEVIDIEFEPEPETEEDKIFDRVYDMLMDGEDKVAIAAALTDEFGLSQDEADNTYDMVTEDCFFEEKDSIDNSEPEDNDDIEDDDLLEERLTEGLLSKDSNLEGLENAIRKIADFGPVKGVKCSKDGDDVIAYIKMDKFTLEVPEATQRIVSCLNADTVDIEATGLDIESYPSIGYFIVDIAHEVEFDEAFVDEDGFTIGLVNPAV